MPSKNYSDIIRNADILAEDYIPADIPGRDPQITELRYCIQPIIRKARPFNAWLYGKSGVGKTSTAKFVLSKLQEEAGITGVYINCWEYATLYAVADKIIHDLRLLRAERSASIFKLEALLRHLGKKPFMVVLDEIDKPSPKECHNILYNLLMLPYVGIYCICNSRSVLVNLEERVRTRLNPRLIEFKPYTDSDLAFIIKQRAEIALAPNTYNQSLLEYIAEIADGNARIAIQTLRNAAIFAESSNSARIAQEHVDKVQDSVKCLEQVYTLRSLSEHHRLLYDIIRERPHIISGELWKTYLMRCEERKVKPIALRTFSPYVNRLISSGLVQSEKPTEWTKARQFIVKQDTKL